MDIFERLAAPFTPDQVEWRVGSTNSDKTKGMALAYITARAVMQRLDDVVGPAHWQDRYEVHGSKTICYLSLLADSEGWVTKADGAGDSDVEAEKGAISDAFKRCAVKWGIGRYLYDLDSPWVDIEPAGRSFRIKKDQYAKLNALLEGKKSPQTEPTTPPKPIPQRPALTDEQKATAALEHAKKHVEMYKAFDFTGTPQEYWQANSDVLERIAKYPEAAKVLKEGGLTSD